MPDTSSGTPVSTAMAAVAAAPADPSTSSGEYKVMEPKWQLITDVLAGLSAVKKNPKYLMKFEGESQTEYERRRESAPWRPEFEDILRSLISKPFSKDVGFKDGVNPRLKELAEDIDGRGNSQTAYAREVFSKAVAKGLHVILVDYPAMHGGDDGPTRVPTIAEEKASGARPYWIHAEADNIRALYTQWVGGKEILSHIRIREFYVERRGFSEVTGTRIRIYEPGQWEVWEKEDTAQYYIKKASGEIRRGGQYTDIPAVLFFTGERDGEMSVKPPLMGLAEMQIELYRQLSKQDETMTYASSPMLTANGMKKPDGDGSVTVGPKAVLYAPPTNGAPASWDYINPDAANVKEVRDHTKSIIEDMQRLGMQPLVRRTGIQTATASGIEGAKAHSSVQAWALGLKDVLEQAWVFTAQWCGINTYPEVTVFTDFSAVAVSDVPLKSLANMRANGDLSRQSMWTGAQRFDVLPGDFDAQKEQELLDAELAAKIAAGGVTLVNVPKRDPITGEAVPGAPAPVPNPTPAA